MSFLHSNLDPVGNIAAIPARVKTTAARIDGVKRPLATPDVR
jgi:hypothetical protein